LLLHDIGYCLAHDRVIGCAVETLPLVLGKQLVDDDLRAGQAADVGGEYTVATELHSVLRADSATPAFAWTWAADGTVPVGIVVNVEAGDSRHHSHHPGCPVDRLINMPRIAENVSLATSPITRTGLPHSIATYPSPKPRAGGERSSPRGGQATGIGQGTMMRPELT